MCACVCVCVYEPVRFRHSALTATAYGRVPPAQRLARASQAGDCTAPGAHQARRPPESETLFPPAGWAAPRRLRLHAARTRPPTTAKKKVQLRGAPPLLSLSGWPPAAERGAQRLSPRGASIPLPASQKFSSRGVGLSGRGPSGRQIPFPGSEGWRRSPRRGSSRRLGAPRVGRGPRRFSERLRAPGARAAGHAVGAGGAERVRRCGSGPPPPPLLLPPVSARGGLSRRSRSSPHATD